MKYFKTNTSKPNGKELESASGGTTYTAHHDGFTFTLKDGVLTVSAGDCSVTTGKGLVGEGFVSASMPIK